MNVRQVKLSIHVIYFIIRADSGTFKQVNYYHNEKAPDSFVLLSVFVLFNNPCTAGYYK